VTAKPVGPVAEESLHTACGGRSTPLSDCIALAAPSAMAPAVAMDNYSLFAFLSAQPPVCCLHLHEHLHTASSSLPGSALIIMGSVQAFDDFVSTLDTLFNDGR